MRFAAFQTSDFCHFPGVLLSCLSRLVPGRPACLRLFLVAGSTAVLLPPAWTSPFCGGLATCCLACPSLGRTDACLWLKTRRRRAKKKGQGGERRLTTTAPATALLLPPLLLRRRRATTTTDDDNADDRRRRTRRGGPEGGAAIVAAAATAALLLLPLLLLRALLLPAASQLPLQPGRRAGLGEDKLPRAWLIRRAKAA